eukprot:353851-Chlamydomonas_euryale.AAC.11
MTYDCEQNMLRTWWGPHTRGPASLSAPTAPGYLKCMAACLLMGHGPLTVVLIGIHARLGCCLPGN